MLISYTITPHSSVCSVLRSLYPAWFREYCLAGTGEKLIFFHFLLFIIDSAGALAVMFSEGRGAGSAIN